MDVNPVCCSRWDMTPQAVFPEVSRNLFIGCIGLEQRASPTVAPERTVGVPPFFVLDHYEPDFRPRGPMRVAGGHLCVIRAEHFLDQDCTVRKPPPRSSIYANAGPMTGPSLLL